MAQKKLFNLYIARTAGLLSAVTMRRAAMALLVMLLTASGAWAQDVVPYGDFCEFGNDQLTWEITGEDENYTLTISGEGGIPDGKPWFVYSVNINTVIIGEGVTSIGDHAFSYCTSLTSVTIPASVTSIGEFAFSGCTSLASVTIPASVEIINAYAFEECSSLASVTFDGDSQLEYILNYAFEGCSSLTSITIPAGVVRIYNNPFEGCTSLTTISVAEGNTSFKIVDGVLFSYDGTELKIYPCSKTATNYTIPEGVTFVSGSAFKGCTNLESVTIPASVTTIDDNAFARCNNLSDVTFYGSPSCTLGDDAFFNCEALSYIYVFGDLVDYFKSADDWSYYKDYIYELPYLNGNFSENDESDVRWIYDYGTETLTIVKTGEMSDMPNFVSKEDQPWLDYREGINTVIIGEGVTSIGDHAFSDCTSLASVTIPASVTSIGDHAFSDCTSLASVTIPASVEIINAYAFEKCSSLASVTFDGDSQLASIDDNAFINCSSLLSITIPVGVSSIYGNPFEGCTSLTTISVADGNTYFKIVDGVLLSYDGTELKTYPYAKTATNYTIPEGVTIIGNNAFRDCTYLESITIPTGQIGNSAFEGCSNLTTVYIGSGVTSIGWDAFCFCTSVTDVYCYADPDKLTWMESWCDDFQSYKATQCHVIKSKLEVFNAKWNTGKEYTDVNVTFVGDIATYKVDLTAIGKTATKFTETLPDQKTLRQCYKEATGGTEPSSMLLVSNVVLTKDGGNVTVGGVNGWDTPITITGPGISEVTVTASIGNIPSTITFTITVTESVGLSETIGITDDVATEMAGKVGVFSRTFSSGKASTICLPFPMTSVTGGKVYEFRDVTYDAAAGWVATMSDATPDGNQVTETEANKPYLFMPTSNNKATFSGTVPVAESYAAGTSESIVSDGTWTFHGTYERLVYDTAPFEGNVYGFASTDATTDDGEVQAGEFVKADTGAGVPPFRCYLTYSGSNSALQARGSTRSGEDQIPNRITVRLIGKNGETEGIGTLTLSTGEFSTDGWYSLDGRRLDGKPTKKGLYIHDGKKFVIK